MKTIKVTSILSWIIVVLAAAASVGGLLLPGLYRDNDFVNAVWQGNDLVTLVVAIPALLVAMHGSRKGNPRALLIWVGLLDYLLYNYAFYLFAASFNAFFLLYVTLFALSIWALIYAASGLDVKRIAAQFKETTPYRWIGGFMLFIAAGLTGIYLMQTFAFIFNGTIPPVMVNTETTTSIVFALDLTLLVPFMVVGAVWLFQKKPWGYALAGIFLAKGAGYTLVLTVGSLSGYLVGGFAPAISEVPLWAMLFAGCLVFLILLMRNLKPTAVQE